MDKQRLVDGWVEFIDRGRWDLFVTITFRESKTSGVAKRMYKHFFKHLNSQEKVFFKRLIYSIEIYEKDNYRDGVHIHSFINGINPKYAKDLERICTDRFGSSRIEPYCPGRGANYYLSSKLASSRLVDYDSHKINSRYRGKRGKYESDKR